MIRHHHLEKYYNIFIILPVVLVDALDSHFLDSNVNLNSLFNILSFLCVNTAETFLLDPFCVSIKQYSMVHKFVWYMPYITYRGWFGKNIINLNNLNINTFQLTE